MNQVEEMQTLYPDFRHTVARDRTIRWKGYLQPTPESPRYEIQIDHKSGRAPVVRVTQPAIRPGARHKYPDGSLCLYWPKDPEWRWSPDESLGQTIVPWAALWLYYYEAWLVVGEWLGPSAPHARKKGKGAKS